MDELIAKAREPNQSEKGHSARLSIPIGNPGSPVSDFSGSAWEIGTLCYQAAV
jgi:hypothetical protein